MKEEEAEVEERRKERELSHRSVVGPVRRSYSIEMGHARETSTADSKARRGSSQAGDYRRYTARTAILIDDLSLNPLKSPAGGVAARSRSRRAEFFPREKKTEREKEFAARGGGPLAEDEEIEVPNVAGWSLLAERGIQCCCNALVGTGQPVETRGDQSARGRLPNNNKLAPLLRVEDLGLFVSVSSCFRPYTAPLTERVLCFTLIRKADVQCNN